MEAIPISDLPTGVEPGCLCLHLIQETWQGSISVQILLSPAHTVHSAGTVVQLSSQEADLSAHLCG